MTHGKTMATLRRPSKSCCIQAMHQRGKLWLCQGDSTESERVSHSVFVVQKTPVSPGKNIPEKYLGRYCVSEIAIPSCNYNQSWNSRAVTH